MTGNCGSDSWKRYVADEGDSIPSNYPGSRPTGTPRNKRSIGSKVKRILASLLVVSAIALSVVGTSSCASLKNATKRVEGSAASAETHDDASDEVSGNKLSDSHTIIFDSALIEALGYDSASDFIDDGKGVLDTENVKTGYISAEVTSDGSARVTMSGLQLEQRKLLIQGKIDEARLPYDNSRLSIASDLKTVDVHPTRDEAFEVKLDSIMFNAYQAAVYCMEMQVLNHPGDASWNVLVRVHDYDSGRLIAQGDMRDGGVSYTEEDWDAGETTD